MNTETTATKLSDQINGKTIRLSWTDGPTKGTTQEHVFHKDGTVEWHSIEPKNGSCDLSEKWLKPSTGAGFHPFLSTAPRLAKNLLKQALARLSADFTNFLKIHLTADRAKPERMAIHGAFEPIA